MKLHHTIPAFAAMIVLANTASADLILDEEEHFDVWLRIVDNQVVTGAMGHDEVPIAEEWRVFGGEFGEDPQLPFFADHPGFMMLDGTVPGGSLFTVAMTGAVTAWTGDGFADTVETITLEYAGQSFTSGDGYVDGFDFAADDEGGFHGHFDITINGDGGDPAPGIYLLPLSLRGADGSFAESDTFWFVMNLDMDEEMHEAAVMWVEQNLVPAPGALALLAGLGLIGRRRRR